MTVLNERWPREAGEIRYPFRIKDKWSAITHFFGFTAAIGLLPVLLVKACAEGDNIISMTAFSVYMVSMILLYGASTCYHALNVSPRVNLILKRCDHMSIFVLIAGSYTPFCLTVLMDSGGVLLLKVIWSLAMAGIVFKLFWVTSPKWVSSVIYTAMGWTCLSVVGTLWQKLGTGFFWLLAGGIMYTAGAVIYAIKPKWTEGKAFGNHEIFHVFVLLGSLCHFIVMFNYLTLLA